MLVEFVYFQAFRKKMSQLISFFVYKKLCLAEEKIMSFLFSIVLFSLPFIFYVEGGACNGLSDGSSRRTRSTTKSHQGPCAKKYGDLSGVHGNFPECQCNQQRGETNRVEQCFNRRICKKECEKKAQEYSYTCNEVSRELNNACESQCESNPTIPVPKEMKGSCIAESTQTIKSRLEYSCKEAVGHIKGPGILICPYGDINNPCGDFCNRQIPQDLSEICEDTTTRDGFKACWEGLQTQVNSALPQNPNKLPDGFSWQQCALNMPCAQKIEVAFNSVFRECESLKNKAKVCCDDPVKCPDQGSAAFNNQGLFRDVGSVASGMAEKCRQIKEKFSSVGNVAQKMADQCRSSASNCVQSCDKEVADNLQYMFRQTCAFDLVEESVYDRNHHTCSAELIRKYVYRYKKEITPLFSECEGAGRKADQLAQSAESILKSALSAARCEEEASGGIGTADPSQQVQAGRLIGGAGGPSNQLKIEDPALKWSAKEKDKPLKMGNEGGGASSRSLSAADDLESSSAPSAGGKSQAAGQSGKTGAAGKKGAGKTITGGGGSTTTAAHSAGTLDQKNQLGKKAQAADKTKGKAAGKEQTDKLALRQFAGKGSKNQKGQLSWDQIKPRQNLNTRISAFGSPHDNIFQRISNRIIVLCRQEKLHCP